MEIKFLTADPALAELFYEFRQDPITNKYNPLTQSTVDELRDRLSKASSDWSKFGKADSFFWFLEFESKIIGTASVRNINRMMLTAEIGYGISANSRGKGLATKAVLSLAQQVFVNTPLRKLIALVHQDNLPSRKVLEKVGFKEEGILREHFLVNGLATNEVIYGILRREIV